MPHYSKAPITEALIDIQVRLPGAFNVEELSKVPGDRADQFERVSDLRQSSVQLRMGEQQQVDTRGELCGFVFRSADNKRVMNVRRDGFSFSRLAPYERWESLRDEARALWDNYRKIALPEAVTRIAVKCVNRFDLPLPIKELKDFFKTYPEVSLDLPQELVGFFTQLQLPYHLKDTEVSTMLVLTQAVVPPPQTGLVSIVLDVDLFCPSNPPSDEHMIWELLESLRQGRNAVFEGCITDATRELIR